MNYCRLHLGIVNHNPTRIDVTDCACDSFYEMFRDISFKNSRSYNEVFKCIPSNHLLTFKSVQKNHKQTCLNKTSPIEVSSFKIIINIEFKNDLILN